MGRAHGMHNCIWGSSDASGGRQMIAAQPKLRILVVENDILLQLAAKVMLVELDHAVVGCASSAQGAIAEAERTRPDVVLMDIELNGPGDGIDAASEIWSRLGVISLFMTGATDDSTRQRALAICPLGYLPKPVTLNDLRGALDRLPRVAVERPVTQTVHPQATLLKPGDA